MSNATPIGEILENLNAGTFAAGVEHAMAEVALATVTTGKKGKVVLTFDFKQIAQSSQVNITHSLKFNKPKVRGSVVEDTVNETPMHVEVGGKLSMYPEKSGDFFKDRPTIEREAREQARQ